MRIIAALALFCAFFITPVEARQHHRSTAATECNVTMPCDFSYEKKTARVARVQHERITSKAQKHHEKEHFAVAAQITPESGVVEHPPGCPWRAFCGCGAAVRIFGKPFRNLWLAANWFKFPRAEPAPMTAGVRRHHVFVLLAHRHGNVWLVYDANSGGHATRIHERSIVGYTIVNPHPS
jgi:hypothetical protein